MEFLLSVLFSTFETITIFMLFFTLYRHRSTMMQLLHIGLFGMVLAVISYVLRVKLGFSFYDTAFQTLLTFLFIRFIFKMKWISIGIVLLSGLSLYFLLQIIVVIALQGCNLYNYDDDQMPTSSGSLLLQVVTVLVGLSLAWILKKKNLGFSFISFHPFNRYKKVNNENQLSLSLIITGCVLALSIASFFISSGMLLYVALPLVIISFVHLIRQSYAIELKDLDS